MNFGKNFLLMNQLFLEHWGGGGIHHIPPDGGIEEKRTVYLMNPAR